MRRRPCALPLPSLCSWSGAGRVAATACAHASALPWLPPTAACRHAGCKGLARARECVVTQTFARARDLRSYLLSTPRSRRRFTQCCLNCVQPHLHLSSGSCMDTELYPSCPATGGVSKANLQHRRKTSLMCCSNAARCDHCRIHAAPEHTPSPSAGTCVVQPQKRSWPSLTQGHSCASCLTYAKVACVGEHLEHIRPHPHTQLILGEGLKNASMAHESALISCFTKSSVSGNRLTTPES